MVYFAPTGQHALLDHHGPIISACFEPNNWPSNKAHLSRNYHDLLEGSSSASGARGQLHLSRYRVYNVIEELMYDEPHNRWIGNDGIQFVENSTEPSPGPVLKKSQISCSLVHDRWIIQLMCGEWMTHYVHHFYWITVIFFLPHNKYYKFNFY